MELGNNLSEDLKTNEDKNNSAMLIKPAIYNEDEFASVTSNLPKHSLSAQGSFFESIGLSSFIKAKVLDNTQCHSLGEIFPRVNLMTATKNTRTFSSVIGMFNNLNFFVYTTVKFL